MKSLFSVLAVLVLALTVSTAFADSGRVDGLNGADDAGDYINFDVNIPCVNIMDARAVDFPDFTFTAPDNAGVGFADPSADTGTNTPTILFDYTSNCQMGTQGSQARRITMNAEVTTFNNLAITDLRGMKITMSPDPANLGTVNASPGFGTSSSIGGATSTVFNNSEATVDKTIIQNINNVAATDKGLIFALGTQNGLPIGRGLNANNPAPHKITLTFTMSDHAAPVTP